MPWDAIAFLLGLIMAGGLLFGAVYVVIMLTDLECDYINPIDLCNNLNTLVMPLLGVHLFMTVMFLLTGCWLAFIINAVFLGWQMYKVSLRRHLFDATDIFRQLNARKWDEYFKVGFFLLSFFYYLFAMIFSLIEANQDTPAYGHYQNMRHN
ncbi:ER-derived vesicles protein ERV14 [Ramicandelaber brevisporus]|nr:ER-derived vesicles protein ERV14 [Ramicandelaber brevisporus]